MQATRECSVPDCQVLIGEHGAKGFCVGHYKRSRTWGDPLGGSPVGTKRPKMTIEDRFWSKVDPSGVCWEWQGYGSGLGYGQFWTNGLDVPAHRWAYEHLVGPISPELHIDHVCRNHACVNPDHLEPVPPRVNILRGNGRSAINARRTHCQRGGHPFSGPNLYVTRDGRRRCKACRREKQRVRNRRRKAG